MKLFDSGIEWIGEIPAEWQTMRLKYLLNERNTRTTTGDETLLSVSVHHGVVPSSVLRQRTMQADSLVGYKVVHKGDMVFNKLNPNLARFGYSGYEGITSPDFAVYYPKEPARIDMRFLVYLIRTPMYIERIKQLTSGVGEGFARLYTDELFGISVGLPPLQEQRRIADYLDERCDAIDEAKKTIEDEVDALQRLRAATIFKAVTKGLDNGVPMRDSGVPWIGEIPSSWAIEKVKGCLRRHDVKGHGDATVLSLYRDHGVVPKDSRDDNHNRTGKDTDSYKYVRKGDLVINKMKAWQGSLSVSGYDGIVSPAYFVYEFWSGKLDRGYADHLLRSAYKQAFERVSGGIREGQWDLPAYDFERMPIPLPPLSEQRRIAGYLDERCAAIDSVIDARTQQLERLEDYRKALIYAYATGKKEVPAS